MSQPGDELQKVFKTFSDPTRIRILRMLEIEELMVQELMEVLGMAQSRVSRHLAILREAGLLRDRRDGTYVFYRFAVPDTGSWRDAWALVVRALGEDATAERDGAAVDRAGDALAGLRGEVGRRAGGQPRGLGARHDRGAEGPREPRELSLPE